VSDILAGDRGCIGSDSKHRDLGCVAGYRMPDTMAREGGQRATHAAATSLRERAGNSEYVVVNCQSRTHERMIASWHHDIKSRLEVTR